MTLAAIIAKHQKAETAPVLGTWEQGGNAETVGTQRVPSVPIVPSKKTSTETKLASTLDSIRAHLLALAECHGFDPSHIHRLQDLDVAACAGLDDPQLVAYLELLGDTATRWAGKRPVGHDAAILCHHCGPVWVHPGVAAVLPVVDGWPRALGCPWCAIRKAGEYIPRPPLQCMACRHFRADTINPDAGICQCGSGRGMHYPMQGHACEAFKPSGISAAPKKELMP